MLRDFCRFQKDETCEILTPKRNIKTFKNPRAGNPISSHKAFLDLFPSLMHNGRYYWFRESNRQAHEVKNVLWIVSRGVTAPGCNAATLAWGLGWGVANLAARSSAAQVGSRKFPA